MEGYGAVTKFSETYGSLMDLFGVRIRQPWTMRHFTIAVTAYGRGVLVEEHAVEDAGRWSGRPGPTVRSRSGRSLRSVWKRWCIKLSEPHPELVGPPS